MKSKWVFEKPQPGDHLRVKMDNFYHHAIYIGNNEVVQFGLSNNVLQRACDVEVLKTNISKFSNDGYFEVRKYSKKELKKKNSPEKIIEIALSKIGEKGYSILHNNCEHFANFCIFNEKTSEQINKLSNTSLKAFKK